ncbi:MAG: TIGR02147 family protein [Bdellovibrionaceae bacterium]|nr:TIGR02147 family protein [Pseudobdellovibrionaceae bacterium]
MSFKLKPVEVDRLLKKENYREFMKAFLQLREEAGKPLSYAGLSRQLGIKSRSYPRDIMMGQKRMTPVLLPKFISVFGLDANLKTYFIDLVEKEEPGCRVSGRSLFEIEKSAERFKSRVRSESPTIRTEDVYMTAEMPRVYAALGSVDKGASFIEITKRTAMDEVRLKLILDKMVEVGLVLKKEKRYFALQIHLQMKELKTDQMFKQYFIKVANDVIYEAQKKMNSDDKLFFSSAFSVSAERMPDLKKDLRQLLSQYVEASEKSEGDKVVSLLCALC